MWRSFVLIFLLLAPQIAIAQEPVDAQKCSTDAFGPKLCIKAETYDRDLCTALETFATRYKLNPYFFTRLIWQESRFDPNARSHADAMGIAQFIASTAELRGLDNPFNPAEALDASARYLADLEQKFGNLGLAAAAYNAGETAAGNFKEEAAGLPNETWTFASE